MSNQNELTILVTSDVHGNVLPINYGNNSYTELGLSKIATIINDERKKAANLLLLDNGDLIQGTPLTYHFVRSMGQEMNPMIKILNELHYDAAIIGNHEFNYGMDVLNQAVNESTFPWLSANIIDSKSNEPSFGKPYIIKDFPSGLKVAILGVTTHYIPNWENPSHIAGLKFEDALETAKTWVKKIQLEEKPDIMVVSYHGGFECDPETGEPTETPTGENQGYRMCHEIEGMDVLITGHQHRSITGSINGVTVIQPSFNAQMLGKITLGLTNENGLWKIDSSDSQLLTVESIDEDVYITKLIKDYENSTQTWLDQPMGTLLGDMTIKDPFETRLKDNALVEFINKVQMDIAEVSISNTALFNNTSKGFPECITMRDVVSNYIYPNTLKVIRISGEDMKEALERCASYFELDNGQVKVNPAFTTPKPQHYNYDMWEGIEYILDISKPFGERVTQLTYEGKPIDPRGEYHVVMNNYRAGGGGEYSMFRNKPVIKDIPLDMSEVIANYILSKGTIEATVNHNWKVIW